MMYKTIIVFFFFFLTPGIQIGQITKEILLQSYNMSLPYSGIILSEALLMNFPLQHFQFDSISSGSEYWPPILKFDSK